MSEAGSIRWVGPGEIHQLHGQQTRRIALIGSAPSSVHLAPYGDQSWEIWGCSPGAAAHVKRIDQWFELHAMNDASMTPDYVQWMANVSKPVHLIAPDPRIPLGITYPRDEVVKEFGPYFFTSSLSWMLALAIREQPAEIGLWGVEMSATEEYALQRPGCHYFIEVAKARGIRVFVPPESDLLRPPMQYGFSSASPMYQKLQSRHTELSSRAANAATNYENARNEWNFLRGAIDDVEYMLKTWVD